MTRRTLLLPALICLLLPACGRTQNTGTTASPAAAAAAADTARAAAQTSQLGGMLQSVRDAMQGTQDADDAERIAAASYATAKALGAIARIMDHDGKAQDMIAARERDLRSEDATRKGKSGKIFNGVIGVRDMFEILYTLRFAGRDDRMAVLDTMQSGIERMRRERADGNAFIGRLADDCFHLVRAVYIDIDADSNFFGQIEQVDQLYAEGRGAAETGEDQFLNGIYRTFEVCQIWAFSLDPRKRNDVRQIHADMISRTRLREGYGHQMATAMEHLYRMIDYIASFMLSRAR